MGIQASRPASCCAVHPFPDPVFGEDTMARIMIHECVLPKLAGKAPVGLLLLHFQSKSRAGDLSPLQNLQNTMSMEATSTILKPWIVPRPHAFCHSRYTQTLRACAH
jgi:hypothetical protein